MPVIWIPVVRIVLSLMLRSVDNVYQWSDTGYITYLEPYVVILHYLKNNIMHSCLKTLNTYDEISNVCILSYVIYQQRVRRLVDFLKYIVFQNEVHTSLQLTVSSVIGWVYLYFDFYNEIKDMNHQLHFLAIRRGHPLFFHAIHMYGYLITCIIICVKMKRNIIHFVDVILQTRNGGKWWVKQA